MVELAQYRTHRVFPCRLSRSIKYSGKGVLDGRLRIRFEVTVEREISVVEAIWTTAVDRDEPEAQVAFVDAAQAFAQTPLRAQAERDLNAAREAARDEIAALTSSVRLRRAELGRLEVNSPGWARAKGVLEEAIRARAVRNEQLRAKVEARGRAAWLRVHEHLKSRLTQFAVDRGLSVVVLQSRVALGLVPPRVERADLTKEAVSYVQQER